MDLSIITVTFQSQDFIADCILSASTHVLNLEYEHIVIDNGSSDGTLEVIESGYAHYVKLIKNQNNRGFAAANQQGVRQAKGRFLLFLNPDMQIQDGFLDELILWMEKNPLVGITGCKLITSKHVPHEALRPSKFPSLGPYLPAFLKWRPFFCTVHPSFFYDSFDEGLLQEVDSVRGAFMLVRKELIEKLGAAFDPEYFILFEDLDFCQRVKKEGLKVVCNPQVSCIDHFGRSFLTQTKAWKYVQMTRSFRTYVKRWHHPLHLIWLNPMIVLGFILRIPEWGLKKSYLALLSTFQKKARRPAKGSSGLK